MVEPAQKRDSHSCGFCGQTGNSFTKSALNFTRISQCERYKQVCEDDFCKSKKRTSTRAGTQLIDCKIDAAFARPRCCHPAAFADKCTANPINATTWSSSHETFSSRIVPLFFLEQAPSPSRSNGQQRRAGTDIGTRSLMCPQIGIRRARML